MYNVIYITRFSHPSFSLEHVWLKAASFEQLTLAFQFVTELERAGCVLMRNRKKRFSKKLSYTSNSFSDRSAFACSRFIIISSILSRWSLRLNYLKSKPWTNCKVHSIIKISKLKYFCMFLNKPSFSFRISSCWALSKKKRTHATISYTANQ